MSRIGVRFQELRERGEGALIGYLTLGDPDIEASEELIRSLCESVDILELGIPFTDPIADGPTIQAAIDRGLKSGMNTDIAFGMVERLRAQGVATPFVFMTYTNIVLQYGEERFLQRCREVGVDGVLISDMPLEEAGGILPLCEKWGVDFIFLIAPTTSEVRLKRILEHGRGFLYLVSLLGVTGAREHLQEATLRKIQWARKYTGDLPLAVGFGISKREHVEGVIQAGAQGAVVGSAFVRLVGEKGREALPNLLRLARELKEGTRVLTLRKEAGKG
jgi:tryptophan synthase alpha chain